MDWSTVGIPDDLTLEDFQKKLISNLTASNYVEQQPVWTLEQQQELSDCRVQAIALSLRNVGIPFELISSPEQNPAEDIILMIGGKSSSWISQIENEWHRHKFSSAQWSIQIVAQLDFVPWDFTQYLTADRGLIGLWASVCLLKHQRKQNVPHELWRLMQVTSPADARLYGSFGVYKDQVYKLKVNLDSDNAVQAYIRAVYEAQKLFASQSERPSWQSQQFMAMSRCFQYRSDQPFILPSVGLLDFSDVDWFMSIDPLMQLCTVFELQGLIIGTPLIEDAIQQSLSLSQALQAMLIEWVPENIFQQYRKVTETLQDRKSMSEMLLFILRKYLQ